jgi:CO/xanthine dehydrogenase FAD-binding subunit
MKPFGYLRPERLTEAVQLLAEHGPEAWVLAGGTDLIVGMQLGKHAPQLIVDLKRIADLPAGIEETPSGLTFAATTVMADIARDARVRHRFPALAEAVQTVGSLQIRHRATLAGNVCNASPGADTVPALLLYGAVMVAAGPDGDRRIPLRQFILGPRLTALRAGELVRAIELPWPEGGSGSAFARLTRRRGVDLATVSLCCSVSPAGEVRFSFGAVAPVPFLVTDGSGALTDPAADPATRDQVLAGLTARASPISDVRAGADYRRAMLVVLSRRALAMALGRRKAGDP